MSIKIDVKGIFIELSKWILNSSATKTPLFANVKGYCFDILNRVFTTHLANITKLCPTKLMVSHSNICQIIKIIIQFECNQNIINILYCPASCDWLRLPQTFNSENAISNRSFFVIMKQLNLSFKMKWSITGRSWKPSWQTHLDSGTVS